MNFRLVINATLASLGFVLGILAAIGLPTEANAVSTSYLSPGYGGLCERRVGSASWNPNGLLDVVQGHRCWHFDENKVTYPYFAGLDLHNGLGGPDAGQTVYWRHYGASWSNVFNVSFVNFAPGSGCAIGVRVVASSPVVASFHYKHVVSSGVVGTSSQNWFSVPGYVEGSRPLGVTATVAQVAAGCMTGPHLHQSADVAWYTDVWRNQPTVVPVGTRDSWNTYTHTISW